MPPSESRDVPDAAQESPVDEKLPITFADPTEPFSPKPLIAELLRTRYCTPRSILLVEDVDIVALPRSTKWRAIRLVLGDGELCVQALLRPEMHRFVDLGTIQVGCYVRLGTFVVEQRDLATRDASGAPAQMVYLVINDLVTVGWHDSLTRVNPRAKQHGKEEVAQEEDEEDFIPSSDIEIEGIENSMAEEQGNPSPKAPARQRGGLEKEEPEDNLDNDGSDFEDMVVSPSKMARRREQISAHTQRTPVALPRDWTDPSIPLKLTPLRSIPFLPYKQNWSMNALVVVTSISPVESCTIPPFTMRKARIADPSTSKQILLTVFLDPEEFSPKVGSVVLLVGVKNHLFDGGSLKKYVSDKPKRPGERWWYEEPRDFAWCDVDGLRAWWETEGKFTLDAPAESKDGTNS